VGYLQLADDKGEVLGFRRAVISLWFRVPQKSIDAAIAARDDSGIGEPPIFNGIIPLMTFGDGGTVDVYSTPFQQMGVQPIGYVTGFDSGGSATWGKVDVPGGDYVPVFQKVAPANPSYIGVECRSEDNINLVASFQTNTKGTLEQYTAIATSLESVSISTPVNPVATSFLRTSAYEDISAKVQANRTESYDILVKLEHAADHWHHVLISCDLSKDIDTTATASDNAADGVKSYNKLWVALDDVNYVRDDAFPNWVQGLDDNATLTYVTSLPAFVRPVPNMSVGFAYIQQVYPPDALFLAGEYTNAQGAPLDLGVPWTAHAALAAVNIPADHVALPAAAKFKDNIRRVELAEFLMFTDVMLDTGIEANRRMFITAKDANGKQFPVNPSPITLPFYKYAIGDPVTWEPGADWSAFAPPYSAFDPSAIPTEIKALGGIASVDFTKCSLNWMMGRNLGTTKSTVVKKGKIKAYFPDPNLGGDQGKP
jgi:hypothetical protein